MDTQRSRFAVRPLRFTPCHRWNLGFAHHAVRKAEAGFALIDSIVAMMVLSLTVILSLSAVSQADRVAKAAWEVRRAHTLLSQLVDTVQTGIDQDISGVADGFSWKVETRATGAERPVPICRRSAVAHNQRSGRSYQAAILESCPLGSPA